MQSNGAYPTSGNWSWIFSRFDGTGAIAYDAKGHTVIQSFSYTLPATIATGLTMFLG
jgi:hypothetical protein